ncbi:hypothetical protein BPA01_48310 [Brevibacillus parabrevis]|uniref:Uncharacterized protein n=1 Tax=Brevibacillus parabrevis TaxID=54914 RepID=A0A4Y3PWT1_BREPA|nr:hypothetical protein BPA01_48310 [Brevibacillus parabrevis]
MEAGKKEQVADNKLAKGGSDSVYFWQNQDQSDAQVSYIFQKPAEGRESR